MENQSLCSFSNIYTYLFFFFFYFMFFYSALEKQCSQSSVIPKQTNEIIKSSLALPCDIESRSRGGRRRNGDMHNATPPLPPPSCPPSQMHTPHIPYFERAEQAAGGRYEWMGFGWRAVKLGCFSMAQKSSLPRNVSTTFELKDEASSSIIQRLHYD